MKILKRVMLGAFAIFMMASISGIGVRAEGEAEKPYLGLDPSTVIDSESTVQDFPEIETYSSGDAVQQMEGSKKGIQGLEWMKSNDAGNLGVKHVLLNLGITQILCNGDTEYTYNGKTYLLNSKYLANYQNQVRQLNAKGIAVTVVLLVQDDRNCPGWEKLVYAPERGHNFYALNTRTEEAKNTWSAVLGFLAQQFGQSDCYIEHWIMGNEVNVPAAYNWTGTTDLKENGKLCAESLVLLYNALENQNTLNPDKPAAKAYISFDQGWRTSPRHPGFGAKEFLDVFVQEINAIQADVNWCIAFHPYAAVMDAGSSEYTEAEKLLWGNNHFTPLNVNAQYVTAANLNVLTDYVKNTYGSQHRIILSEQGFDAKGGETYQSASLAYTFYAGQFNDMVDAIIFRSWEDHPEEFGLQLGISGRQAQNVFKYMDTKVYGAATKECLSKIGINTWGQLVSGFNMPGMAFRDVSAIDWYADSVCAVNDAGIMTGLNATNFGASSNLARGHFATTLYRMEGSPQQEYVSEFPDVPNNYFYSLPVSWANNNGIILGYENGRFGTGDDITREQLATLMFRYAKYKGRDVSNRADLSGYADNRNVSAFASEAMQWIVGEGIIKGEGTTGQLNPQGKVSRAVCATIIQRYLGL